MEDLVNGWIRENADDRHARCSSSRRRGRPARWRIFGEKYGDVGARGHASGPSKELCGGTHVRRTGDIGLFKIASEESIAAGVRRIVAFTGPRAVELRAARGATSSARRGAAQGGRLRGARRRSSRRSARVKELESALDEAEGEGRRGAVGRSRWRRRAT